MNVCWFLSRIHLYLEKFQRCWSILFKDLLNKLRKLIEMLLKDLWSKLGKLSDKFLKDFNSKLYSYSFASGGPRYLDEIQQ